MNNCTFCLCFHKYSSYQLIRVRPNLFPMLRLFFQWMLLRCPTCLRSRASEGTHLVFLFPRESLERTRLKFSLRGGKVTALCLQEGEQVWALNIKRALLSMLQTSRVASKQELEKEVRVDGGWCSTICTRCLHNKTPPHKWKFQNKSSYLDCEMLPPHLCLWEQ